MSEVVLHSKLRELEEELKTERDIRYKHEKEIGNLRIDLDDLDSQLQEANIVKDREVDASKKLRQEYADLKLKYDNLSNETEESNQTYKRRNQDTISELTAHVEALSKSKLKYEKDNKTFLLEIEQLRIDNDSLSRSKAQAVALARELENKESDYLARIDEVLKQLAEANETKNKLSDTNSTLQRRNEHLEFESQQINSNIKKISQDLDDARLQLENEILFRVTVENKYKNIQYELNSANAQLDSANEDRDDLQKQLVRAHEDVKQIRDQAAKDLEAKSEEYEDVKRKLNAKYLEIQDQLTDTFAKLSNSEKLKLKLQGQVENLSSELDRTKKRAEDAVRHEKELERDVNDLRSKLNVANAELDSALQANRNYSIELAKAKNISEQLSEQLDLSQKEKRRLAEDLDITTNQLTDSQTRLIDLERRAKQIDAERQQIQAQLDDVRDLLQAETTKYQNLFAQYEKFKLDMEKRILDKDEELDAQRQAHRRQIEVMQENIEAIETRAKNEIHNLKKKYQGEIEELKSKYENTKRSLAEAENNAKRLQQTLKEVSDKYIEEQHGHDATREQLIASEKRGSSLRGEVEELKTLLDRSDKARKILELEVHDHEQKVQEAQLQLNRALAERKKFESDYLEALDVLHELKIEYKNSEERVRVTSAALVKKDEEIRHERELANEIDAARKVLEQQLRDTQARVEEAEDYARKEAKRIAAKYEGRLAQAESDLELERGKAQEYLKEARRLEKRAKDLASQVEDEQTKVLSLTESHEKLQEKLRKYRGQIEGAEGQVAINLSRCRRLQRELEDAEERAETMTRTFLRGSSVQRGEEEPNYQGNGASAIEEYSNAVHAAHRNNTPSYLRSSYLYSKPTNVDDYTSNYSRASSIGAWKPRFRTVDLEGEDVPVSSAPRSSSRYSGYYGGNS